MDKTIGSGIPDFNKALEINPENPEAYTNRGKPTIFWEIDQATAI